ncbi:DUF4913 domain-containing protein [Nocardia sp. NPDC050175]|uniref:DUF4913 domain-containing protein n=1 Tax=Nocardia sp. NPDC050175 TaxID=3364317 RepID=UPI0037961D0C
MGSASESQGPAYQNLVEFVEKYVTVIYSDAVDFTGEEVRWCPEWWQHPSAIARMDAMWRSWEHLRLDGNTGLSLWFREHGDYHMRELFRQDGPFRRCSARNGHHDVGKGVAR